MGIPRILAALVVRVLFENVLLDFAFDTPRLERGFITNSFKKRDKRNTRKN